jgi:hypothetical protein
MQVDLSYFLATSVLLESLSLVLPKYFALFEREVLVMSSEDRSHVVVVVCVAP